MIQQLQLSVLTTISGIGHVLSASPNGCSSELPGKCLMSMCCICSHVSHTTTPIRPFNSLLLDSRSSLVINDTQLQRILPPCCSIYSVHDEIKDKQFELDLSWVGKCKFFGNANRAFSYQAAEACINQFQNHSLMRRKSMPSKQLQRLMILVTSGNETSFVLLNKVKCYPHSFCFIYLPFEKTTKGGQWDKQLQQTAATLKTMFVVKSKYA